MAEEALARFAREVTAGVPELELRLEARAEILARLEAAAALLATEGVNAEDGAARAIAEQGDPSALAAEFSARYRKRLRRRPNTRRQQNLRCYSWRSCVRCSPPARRISHRAPGGNRTRSLGPAAG